MMIRMLSSATLALLLATPVLATELPSLPDSELFTPGAIETATCWSCSSTSHTTSPGGGAASHWGKGSSCTNAQSDLTNQTRNAANWDCWDRGAENLCSFSVVVTGACWWSSDYGQFVVDGYANYRCRFWLGGPGCIIP